MMTDWFEWFEECQRYVWGSFDDEGYVEALDAQAGAA